MTKDNEDMELNGNDGSAFGAIYETAKKLGIANRLSAHQMQEMSKAVLNTRPKENDGVKEALDMIDISISHCDFMAKAYGAVDEARVNRLVMSLNFLNENLTKIRNALKNKQ